MSNAYPWILTLAIVAGLAWLLFFPPGRTTAPTGRRPAGEARPAFDAGLAALAGGLVGARLGFVLTHPAYVSQDLIEIIRLWRGGLSGPGALLGAAFGLSLFAAAARQPFWRLADTLAAPALLVAAAAWLGCLVDACAFGLPASGSLRLPVSPSLMQVRLPRWPTQAAGALACLAALLFLLRKPTASLPTGVPALIALLTLSLSGLALSFLRGDPAPRWGAMRLDALAWAAALVLGLLALGLRRRLAPNR